MADETKKETKLEKIIESIEKLSVLELNDLVKALQEKFDIQTGPMMAAPAVAGSETDAGKKEEAEQTAFTVVLTEVGEQRISVIQAVRKVNQTLGLGEAKALVDAAPKEVVSDVNKETAEEAKKMLEEAGAKVELK
ncbi:MAG: 50S ribosomal protein L7/L12 [Candidatus Pacebacteria bacterium]|nr:50S ribosomal protein L7/L12 [Candidatus Paceibacterota bacterium]